MKGWSLHGSCDLKGKLRPDKLRPDKVRPKRLRAKRLRAERLVKEGIEPPLWMTADLPAGDKQN